MSENEKRLRGMIQAATWGNGATGGYDAAMALRDLDALLAEHRAEVERRDKAAHEAIALAGRQARDAALEEAKTAITSAFEKDEDIAPQDVIDSLKSRPAEKLLHESKVREVIIANHSPTPLLRGSADDYRKGRAEACADIAASLGVTLDAPPTLSERVATSQAKTLESCAECCGSGADGRCLPCGGTGMVPA